MDPRVGAIRQHLLGIAASGHGVAFPIKEDAIVTNGEDARQFMCDDYHGRPQVRAQLKDQIVEQAGGHRVETGGRFVKEQHIGVERDRACDAGAFLHAALISAG